MKQQCVWMKSNTHELTRVMGLWANNFFFSCFAQNEQKISMGVWLVYNLHLHIAFSYQFIN